MHHIASTPISTRRYIAGNHCSAYGALGDYASAVAALIETFAQVAGQDE